MVDCHVALFFTIGLTVAEEVVTMHQYDPCIASAKTTIRLTWGLAETSASTLPSVAIASLCSHRSCILHLQNALVGVTCCYFSSSRGVCWHMQRGMLQQGCCLFRLLACCKHAAQQHHRYNLLYM